jgi:hypothetical protein
VLAVGVLLRDKEAVVVDDEVEVVLGVGVMWLLLLYYSLECLMMNVMHWLIVIVKRTD